MLVVAWHRPFRLVAISGEKTENSVIYYAAQLTNLRGDHYGKGRAMLEGITKEILMLIAGAFVLGYGTMRPLGKPYLTGMLPLRGRHGTRR